RGQVLAVRHPTNGLRVDRTGRRAARPRQRDRARRQRRRFPRFQGGRVAASAGRSPLRVSPGRQLSALSAASLPNTSAEASALDHPPVEIPPTSAPAAKRPSAARAWVSTLMPPSVVVIPATTSTVVAPSLVSTGAPARRAASIA